MLSKKKKYLKINFGMKFFVHNTSFEIFGLLGTYAFTINMFYKKKNSVNLLLFCTHMQHMLIGFWRGFLVCLLVDGIGYRVTLKNNVIIFTIGFVDAKQIVIPRFVTVFVDNKETGLFLFSSDFVKLMQFTTHILHLKKINVYKGKGISKIGSVFKPKQILKK